MSDTGKPKEVLDLEASPAAGVDGDGFARLSNGNHSSEYFDHLFSLFADTVPQSIWVTDAEGNVKFLNKHWYEYSGTTDPPATAAEIAAESVHPDDAPALMDAFREAIRTGKGFEIEQRNRAADGTYRWFLNRANPYRDPNTGEIAFWFGVGIDIHEGKAAADRIKVSEEQYRALTELSPQMVYMTRPDGSITYANQYTVEWTGKPLEELQGDVWADLIHPDHRERIFNVWRTAAAVASEYEVDVPFRHVDGTYRTLYNRALPIKDENGEVLYWIGTALDVEDRKRAEENLRESEQRF